MLKNHSTTITYTAWNSGTGALCTGDSANHTCSLSLNGGTFATATNSPSEVGAGVYALVLTAAETNADLVTLSVASSTSSVVIPPVQIVFHDASDYKADVSGIPASVWSSATRTLSSPVEVASNSASTISSLSASNVWSAASRTLSGPVEVASASVSSISSSAASSVWSAASRTLSEPVSVASASVSSIASASATDVWAAASRTLSSPPEIASNSVSAIVSSVWAADSRTLSSPVTVSSSSISSIQSGLATASDLATVDSVCDAIQAKTDLIPAQPAAVGSAMTLTNAYSGLTSLTNSSIASAVLGCDISDVESTAPLYSLCTVILAQLQSSVNGTDWTIYRTDGTTQHAVRTITSSSEADPITGVSGS